jgi:hypothetical protein
VLSRWLAQTIKLFFEAKHKIILVPTDQQVRHMETEPFTLGHLDSIGGGSMNQVTEEKQEPLPAHITRNLLEIFNWYCLKHLSVRGDFDRLNSNLSYMNMHGFARFCIEFKVPLDNRSVSEVFKKSQVKNHPLVFDQFEKALHKLAVKLNMSQLEQANKQLDAIRKEQAARDTKADAGRRLKF